MATRTRVLLLAPALCWRPDPLGPTATAWSVSAAEVHRVDALDGPPRGVAELYLAEGIR